ncbi:Exosome complex component RRP43 [Myotis brandtii]|uniref:Exosome complex component RRP43 n=1 Tax=Myotis brandtii TaxID=109478 RepID=S7NAV5_MYOBR|nr:Exosome complex component RRP43 [Myotis brandtii]
MFATYTRDTNIFAFLVQLPEVTINEETALAEANLKKKRYLNIRTHPVATSFAVFDDGLTGAKLQDCLSRAVTRHKEVKKLMDEVIKSMKAK